MDLKNVNVQLRSVGELLADHTQLIIPQFQREYAWGDAQIRDMVEDLDYAMRDDSDHFMGAIVTRHSKKLVEVIDGQQRLTTSFMLIAAIASRVDEMGNDEAAERIRSHLVKKDLISAEMKSCLLFFGHNPEFFVDFCSPTPSIKAGSHASKMRSAYMQLYAQYSSHTMESLLEIVKFVLERLKFIHVAMPENADCFSIFESLNDRGASLTFTDLLKNHLLSKARDEQGQIQRCWTAMRDQIMRLQGPQKSIEAYASILWTVTRETTTERTSGLYRKVRRMIVSRSDALAVADDLAKYSAYYCAINDPNHTVWRNNGHSADTLQTMHLLQKVIKRASTPLSMVVLAHADGTTFLKYLRWMLCVETRMKICAMANIGVGTNDVFNGVARDIHTEGEVSFSEIVHQLMHIVPTDESFMRAFTEMRGGQDAILGLYFLLSLDHVARRGVPSLSLQLPDNLHLVPVMPNKPNAQWPGLSTEVASAGSRYLGNYVLSSKKFLATQPMSFSKASSENSLSAYVINLVGQTSTPWTIDSIRERQARLADLAVNAWPRFPAEY